MKRERFHAGGEADYKKAVEPLRERDVVRRMGRFYKLVGLLCRRSGPMRGWRIRLAGGRISARYQKKLRAADDRSRALWLRA